MLAKIDWSAAPCEPKALPDYSGFPLWEAFVTDPNKERKICDFLLEKIGIAMYWPHFTSFKHWRGRMRTSALRSVVPCVIFAPLEFLNFDDRDRILEWVHIRPLRLTYHLTKVDIEMLREIEARLAIHHQGYGEAPPCFKTGQDVKFRNDVYADKFGDAVVTKVAPGGRIGVRIKRKLFGSRQDIVVSAVELEAK